MVCGFQLLCVSSEVGLEELPLDLLEDPPMKITTHFVMFFDKCTYKKLKITKEKLNMRTLLYL